MMTIWEQPGNMAMARSPIFSYVIDTNYENDGFYYIADIYVWTGDKTSDKPSVPTLRLSRYPDAKNGAAFDVSDICNSMIDDYLAREAGAKFTSGVVFCIIEFGYVDDAGENADQAHTGIFAVTKGYTEYIEGVNKDFELESYGGNNRPKWLTDRNTTIRVFDGYYFTIPITYRTNTNGMFKVKFWDDNGNIHLIPIYALIGDADDSSERVLLFQCGYNSWLTDSTNLAAKVAFNSVLNPTQYYYCRGEDNAGNAVTKTFTFEICEAYQWEPYTIQFINKYGVWDYLICEGRKRDSIEIERNEVFRNPLKVDIGVGVSIDSVRGQYSAEVMAREAFTINTGWLNETDNELVKQLLVSKRVICGDSPDGGKSFEPLVVTMTGHEEKTQRGEKLISYDLQIKKAFDYINSVK